MSGKNGKKRSGDPRKQTSENVSGRVTPPKKKPRETDSVPPPFSSPVSNPVPAPRDNPSSTIRINLNEVIRFIAAPLEKIPQPDKPYYVEGFEAFNPLFDDDEYFLNLREAFAREMKITLGGYYPHPTLAHSAHLLFVERLLEKLQERIPQIARDTQSTLEMYFRSRFNRHSEPGSFERWDKESLNGFFADRRLERLAESEIPIKYIDEIVEGPVPIAMQGSYSTVMHNIVVEGDEVDFVPKAIALLSITINNALCEGYSFDEIVDGIARHALSFEIINFASTSRVTDIQDDCIDVQFGLSMATLNDQLEFVTPALGKWGHCGFLSSLHCRLGDDIGIGYWAEQSMIELLDQYDPLIFERLFAALVSESTDDLPHEIVTNSLKQFIRDVFDDPDLAEPLLHLTERSIYGMEEAAALQLGLFTALNTNERWGTVARAITRATQARNLDYTFFTTPQAVLSAFNDLAR